MVNFKPGEYTRKMFFFHSVTAQVKKKPSTSGYWSRSFTTEDKTSHAALDKVYVVTCNISHDYSQLLSIKERAFTLAFHTGVMAACTCL